MWSPGIPSIWQEHRAAARSAAPENQTVVRTLPGRGPDHAGAAPAPEYEPPVH
jgi:hypothetical protein